jgi:hypothetical protein
MGQATALAASGHFRMRLDIDGRMRVLGAGRGQPVAAWINPPKKEFDLSKKPTDCTLN